MAREFNEDDWLQSGKLSAKDSVDSGMDEKTAYAYGYLHGAREMYNRDHFTLSSQLAEARALLGDCLSAFARLVESDNTPDDLALKMHNKLNEFLGK